MPRLNIFSERYLALGFRLGLSMATEIEDDPGLYKVLKFNSLGSKFVEAA